MRQLNLFSFVLLCLAGVQPATATIRDDAAAAIVLQTQFAGKSGDVASVDLEIVGRPGVVLEGLELRARSGWTESRIEHLPIDVAAKSNGLVQLAHLRLSARALEAPTAWTLRYFADGELMEEELDLASPRVATPELITALEPVPALPAAQRAGLTRPEPAPLDPTAGRYEIDPGKTTRTIRVHGRLVCRRADASGITTLGVDGATIKVHDDEGLGMNNLANMVTDADGYFDISFSWDDGDLIDPQPDIVVEAQLANGWVQMRTTSIVSGNTAFRMFTRDDYLGTDINIGTFSVADPAINDAMYVLTVATRAARWHESMGYALPTTTFRYPNADGSSFFRSLNGTIYIGVGDQFQDAVIVHEQGHRWVEVFSQGNSYDYCNDTCFMDQPTCEHCIWCEETAEVAWNEGFPDFLGDFVPKSFNSTYSVGTNGDYILEWIVPCRDDLLIDDPDVTEGRLAAYVVDLVDTNDENDPAITSTWRDRAQLNPATIMSIADQFSGLEALEFVSYLFQRLQFVGTPAATLENVWETAKNNGYEVDVAAPNNPSAILCSTHTAGVSTRANWPQFNWSTPGDDASGISGYALSITSGAPASPSLTQNIGRVNSYRPASPLTPGTYYFNLKTVDRAGRWASGYVSFGPLVILTPQQTDFARYVPEFWDDSVVPRDDTLGDPGQVFDPDNLIGWTNQTYLNGAYQNISASSLSAPEWYTGFLIDGVSLIAYGHAAGVVGASQVYLINSNSPVNVRGGRHTLSMILNSTGSVGESDQLNNRYGRQWIWSPQAVPAIGASSSIFVPRARDGGWDDIPGGTTAWYNADGYRLDTTSGETWWHAVVLRPALESEDYELRLHEASTGPTNGFTTNLGYSARPTGRLEALFTNRNNVGEHFYDVGVLNVNTAGYQPVLETVGSVLIDYASDLEVTMATERHLELREIYVGATQLGSFSARIQIDPTEDPITMLWLDRSFTTGDILDYTAATMTDETGHAQLDVNVTTAGFHCLVLYREGSHVALKTSAPMSIALETGPTPTNLRPHNQLAGWAAALVPRPAADGLPNSVPAPTVLYGDLAQTYLNLASMNTTWIGSPASSGGVRLDGLSLTTIPIPALGALSIARHNGTTPFTVRGGRHTLSVLLDPTDLVDEALESDNSHGAQWIFQPANLALNTPLVRPIPPDPIGGTSEITITVTPGEGVGEGGATTISPTIYPNCDGMRLPAVTPVGDAQQWLAVATMSGSKSNVDLQLYEASSGPTNGFAESLASSSWGESESDFVLVNQRGQNPRPFDAGIFRNGVGQETYTIHSTSSNSLGSSEGSFGPFTLAAQRIVALHEIWLDAGTWTLNLGNVAGTVNWGVSVHPPLVQESSVVQGKSDAMATTSLGVAGAGESLNFSIAAGTDGYYCIAVWKTAASELPKTGDYVLELHGDPTAADELPNASIAQFDVRPNPFNPRTQIRFELGEAVSAELDVLNERGSRVRRLSSGRFEAGVHEVTFDGIDDRGRRLASGVYFVQLRAGSQARMVEKVVLLK